jgi:RNA polymerase sigma-70 factor (ECF subfamily)
MPADEISLESPLREAVGLRYGESRAADYGISRQALEAYVAAVVALYGAAFSRGEKLELIASLHIEDLVLARACYEGNHAAWQQFLVRFRKSLQNMAVQITREVGAGRELADGLYAELYGMPNREGRRISKLQYYMGRGSLQGWLRTVLAQKHVDRCRSRAKEVSLEEQEEAGNRFAAPEQTVAPAGDERVARCVDQALSGLNSEERLLLASYYLDRRTLADIARQIGVHESTVSRKLERIAGALRKKLRQQLQAGGLDLTQCDELMAELDVRDLNVDVEGRLRQEPSAETF